MKILILFAVLFSLVSVAASQPESDREAVKRAALDYIEAVYDVDATKAERSVHPELVKRGFSIRRGSSEYAPSSMTFDQFVQLSKTYNAKGGIPKDAPKEVVIFDVVDQTASVKVTAIWGIDYMHLAKYDGKWKIINILWQSPPRKAAP